MPYCPECGAETTTGDSFCNECGVNLTERETDKEVAESEDTDVHLSERNREEPAQTDVTEAEQGQSHTPSSIWPLVGVGLLYLAFIIVAWNSPPGAVAGIIVLASLPVLWYDAVLGVRSGELDVSRPIYIVVAVLLLWLLTVPVYLIYRLYTRRKN